MYLTQSGDKRDLERSDAALGGLHPLSSRDDRKVTQAYASPISFCALSCAYVRKLCHRACTCTAAIRSHCEAACSHSSKKAPRCLRRVKGTRLGVFLGLATAVALVVFRIIMPLLRAEPPPMWDAGSTPVPPMSSQNPSTHCRGCIPVPLNGNTLHTPLDIAQLESLPGLASQLPSANRRSFRLDEQVLYSALDMTFGPGNVSVAMLGDVPVLIQRFVKPETTQDRSPAPLHTLDRCKTGASPGGMVSESFLVRSEYAAVDRMGDRSASEPTFRFVSLMSPLEPGSVDFAGAGNGDGPGGGHGVVDFPHIEGKDLDALCASLHYVRLEALPEGGCPQEPASAFPEPFPGGPWCAPWRAPVFIGELACGFVENGLHHPDAGMSVIAASGALMSHKLMRTGLAAGITVQEFDMLAVPGYVEYAATAGHFFNEVLPRLLHLDAHLPPAIPLLWPSGTIPAETLAMLRALGVFRADRRMVEVSTEPSLMRARKLYFFGSTEPLATAPLVPWLTMRYLSLRLQHALNEIDPEPLATRSRITVLARKQGEARSLSNHNELVDALRNSFPQADVAEWFPTPINTRQTAIVMRRSRVVVGVHGANLNNFMFARPSGFHMPAGTGSASAAGAAGAAAAAEPGSVRPKLSFANGTRAVRWQQTDAGSPEGTQLKPLPPTALVEIGFLDKDFHQPTDYLCLARNLGAPYWLTLPLSGSYVNVVKADVEQVVAVVRRALAATSGSE